MQKWEYMTLTRGFLKEPTAWLWINPDPQDDSDIRTVEERLNELGKEGWELVNIGSLRGYGRPQQEFYFKRPIE